jgi:hypothetical protein
MSFLENGELLRNLIHGTNTVMRMGRYVGHDKSITYELGLLNSVKDNKICRETELRKTISKSPIVPNSAQRTEERFINLCEMFTNDYCSPIGIKREKQAEAYLSDDVKQINFYLGKIQREFPEIYDVCKHKRDEAYLGIPKNHFKYVQK